jgi:CRP-like cAMP-binding protein
MSANIDYKAGDMIIKQGFPGDHAYIIKQGVCEVYYIENDLSETHLAELKEGEMFGEQSLLEESPRNACVRAKTDVVLQVMDI